MLGLIVLVIVLVAASLLVDALGGWTAWRSDVRDQIKQEEVIRRLRETDAKVASDSRAAKRAMNDAAGQSWRNQFE